MKSKLFWGSAILCCTLAFGFASCSDDDDDEIKISETLTRTGINTEFDGGIYRIPVECSGKWTASVPDDVRWVTVVRKEGKSGESATIFVAGTYDGISRNTKVTVKCGSVSVDVPVNQVVDRENALEDLTGFALVRSRGLGFGYNVNTYKSTSKTVFNLKAIEEVMETFPVVYSNLILDQRHAILEAVDSSCDSIEKKTDNLAVKISVDISYGTFKMGITGGMHAGEQRNSYTKHYHLASNYPLYEAKLNVNGILKAYRDWVKEGKPEVTKDGKVDFRGIMVDDEFMEVIEKLNDRAEETNVDNVKDDTKLQNLCADIISKSGPVIIASSTLGGSYMLDCYMDSIFTKETFGIDDAKATAAIEAAVFKLKAEVDVDYQKEMEETLKHAYFIGKIYGGKTDDQQQVYDTFLKNPKDFNDKVAINTWSKGLSMGESTKDCNVELISTEQMGVWDFLSRGGARFMKQYVLSRKNYKDNEIINKLIELSEEEDDE